MTCGTCDAEILWAETTTGALQPFNRTPDPEGNRVLLGRGPNRPPLAIPANEVNAGAGMYGPLLDECRYMPHHATCPQAAQHRKR